MVDALDAAVGAGVEGAGVDLVDATTVVDDGSKFGGKGTSVVGGKRRRAPPEMDVVVEKDVSGAGGRELSCRDGRHIGTAAG